MKIPGYRLATILTSELKPLYLITGDEFFLRDQAVRSILLLAKKNGFVDIIKWRTQQEDELLGSLLYSRGLFQTKQLVLIDFGDKTPTIKQQKLLEPALTQPDSELCIIILCKKLDTKMQYAAWVTAVDKKGVVITIWPLNHEQLKIFIMSHAKKYRTTLQSDATKLLADFAEGNVVLAAQTIEKAYLLGETHITASLIKELIVHDGCYTVFDLGDAFIMQDIARMLTILDNLQEAHIEPAIVLWSLTREIRLLIDCLNCFNQGHELKEPLKKHNVFGKKQEMIHRQIQHHSLHKCYQWLQQAFLIDQKIKKFLIADAWREIQIFCLRA